MKSFDYYERKINYYETDKMAIVHHSNYARYLEECRVEWMAVDNMPLEILENRGYMIPVVELNERFIESARFGDTIRIVPELTKVTPARFQIAYKIYNGDMSRVIHEATTLHCIINREYKPVNMKKDIPEFYEALMNSCACNDK